MRSLLVINATLDEATEKAIAAGRSPRKDYLELRRALDADLIEHAALEKQRWARLVRRLFGASVAQSVAAWVRAARYDAVFVDREPTGFILAALLKLRRRRPRLVMIGHLLTPAKKRLLFRALRLHTAVDCLVVHSSLQRDVARTELRLRPDQIAMIPYHSDVQFWSPAGVPVKHQICSAGLEYRDHNTFIDAVRDLDVAVVIAAASHWSKHRDLDEARIPANVRIVSLDYASLRRLYAESLFVVVPLHDVDNQAGITTILEAMAMGKAVIVSHSRGQSDVVRDRRRQNRIDPARATQPGWVQQLGADESIAAGQTGIYVMPGDVAELRRAVAFLLAHPQQARLMGANGRRVVASAMSLDHYTQRLAEIISGEPTGTGGNRLAPQVAAAEA